MMMMMETDQVDVDGSGAVEWDEFCVLMYRKVVLKIKIILRIIPSISIVCSIITIYSADDFYNTLLFREWIKTIQGDNVQMREKNPEEELKEAFRVFDAEGTGVIGKFSFYNLSLCCSYNDKGTGVIGQLVFNFHELSEQLC